MSTSPCANMHNFTRKGFIRLACDHLPVIPIASLKSRKYTSDHETQEKQHNATATTHLCGRWQHFRQWCHAWAANGWRRNTHWVAEAGQHPSLLTPARRGTEQQHRSGGAAEAVGHRRGANTQHEEAPPSNTSIVKEAVEGRRSWRGVTPLICPLAPRPGSC